MIESLVRDLQLAIRNLIRYPGYSLAAVATLTVGLGATIAVYSVVDRVLFRPLPYPDESRILWFGMKAPVGGDNFALGPDYQDWKEAQTARLGASD